MVQMQLLSLYFPTLVAGEAFLWRDHSVPSCFLLTFCYWAMSEEGLCTPVLSSGPGLEQFCLQWNLDGCKPHLVPGKWPHLSEASALTSQHCSQAPLGLPDRMAWNHQTIKSVLWCLFLPKFMHLLWERCTSGFLSSNYFYGIGDLSAWVILGLIWIQRSWDKMVTL